MRAKTRTRSHVEKDLRFYRKTLEDLKGEFLQASEAGDKAEMKVINDRLRDMDLNIQSCEDQLKKYDREAAEVKASEKEQSFRENTDAAIAAEKAVGPMGDKLDAAIDLVAQTYKELLATGHGVAQHVDAALERTVGGDRSFMMAALALQQRLKFAGLPIRGVTATREPPSVGDAVKQAVHNFLGELRIEARKRGLPQLQAEVTRGDHEQ